MKIRACPICPKCGSKKFKRIDSYDNKVIVECLSCMHKMLI
ncbi:MAG: hypothetical protein KatS3mg003_1141 [Candidatus Nitrosocaldaceae archaeon]|nr:MAG: hypothetical protein KatS3mg003_1141 [Candidatus Nitrosocaldaceae archaeon]